MILTLQTQLQQASAQLDDFKHRVQQAEAAQAEREKAADAKQAEAAENARTAADQQAKAQLAALEQQHALELEALKARAAASDARLAEAAQQNARLAREQEAARAEQETSALSLKTQQREQQKQVREAKAQLKMEEAQRQAAQKEADERRLETEALKIQLQQQKEELQRQKTTENDAVNESLQKLVQQQRELIEKMTLDERNLKQIFKETKAKYRVLQEQLRQSQKPAPTQQQEDHRRHASLHCSAISTNEVSALSTDLWQLSEPVPLRFEVELQPTERCVFKALDLTESKLRIRLQAAQQLKNVLQLNQALKNTREKQILLSALIDQRARLECKK